MARIGKAFILARIGLGAAAAAGALTSASARAQISQSSLTLDGRTFAISPSELIRLTDLGRTVHSRNRGAQDSALAAARAVANSRDARYLLAIYQLEIGRLRQDDALRAQALDVLIPDRQTPSERLPAYLGLRGDIAFRGGDYAAASALWGRLAGLQPENPQTLVNLAQVRAAQQDAEGAIALIRRAIAAHRTGPSPEGWYRQWLTIAHNAHLLVQGAGAGHALVTAYPTPENWRFALVAYRQLAAPQGGAEIDLFRLMRAAGVLAHSDEYQRLTQLLLREGLAVEAKAVLDEGVSRGIVNGIEAPIPDIRREIDRALQPQRARPASAAPTDGAAVGYRLAVGLALAGRRPEAETALRAIAGGPSGDGRFYPDLALFWLDWLARSG
jgi:tetratricopeptide (TPR) repeat protein